jgi:hypothetical protein
MVRGRFSGRRATDWRKIETYAWMHTLPRRAWAWEFLRRNPGYTEAWSSAESANGLAYVSSGLAEPAFTVPDMDPAIWGLVSFRGTRPRCP